MALFTSMTAEVDAPAAEVVRELREIRLMTDQQEMPVPPRQIIEQRERLRPLEATAEWFVDHDIEPELDAGETRRVERANARAGVRRGELDSEPGERPAGEHRLPSAPGGQLAVGVRTQAVWLGLAVAQEPELTGHPRTLLRSGRPAERLGR